MKIEVTLETLDPAFEEDFEDALDQLLGEVRESLLKQRMAKSPDVHWLTNSHGKVVGMVHMSGTWLFEVGERESRRPEWGEMSPLVKNLFAKLAEEDRFYTSAEEDRAVDLANAGSRYEDIFDEDGRITEGGEVFLYFAREERDLAAKWGTSCVCEEGLSSPSAHNSGSYCEGCGHDMLSKPLSKKELRDLYMNVRERIIAMMAAPFKELPKELVAQISSDLRLEESVGEELCGEAWYGAGADLGSELAS